MKRFARTCALALAAGALLAGPAQNATAAGSAFSGEEVKDGRVPVTSVAGLHLFGSQVPMDQVMDETTMALWNDSYGSDWGGSGQDPADRRCTADAVLVGYEVLPDGAGELQLWRSVACGGSWATTVSYAGPAQSLTATVTATDGSVIASSQYSHAQYVWTNLVPGRSDQPLCAAGEISTSSDGGPAAERSGSASVCA